ncbi:MAG: LD-carboxypeptidase [Candidatus Paracaedibacteraceae bacterium]|nr:LD-carboxypeptidase [Candidatus Paracaedibacteraceae bacterium]
MKFLLVCLYLCLFVFNANVMCSQQWCPLENGDAIEVIAPSYGSLTNLIGIEENIKKIGFSANIAPGLIAEQQLGYANTEEYRKSSFRKAISKAAPAKVVWALRGGRGASSLFSEGTEPFNEAHSGTPKLFIGFSDATAIHLYLNVVLNWPSLHGVVLAYNKDVNPIVNKETSLSGYRDILTGKVRELSYILDPINDLARTIENIDSTSVIGGNASLIQRSIGTSTCPQTIDKIFFIEDTGEAPTKLYEIITHFRRAGLLNAPKAIMLGSFSITREEYVNFLTLFLEQIDNNIPVYEANYFGHGDSNFPLFFNTPAGIKLESKRVTLKVSTNNW